MQLLLPNDPISHKKKRKISGKKRRHPNALGRLTPARLETTAVSAPPPGAFTVTGLRKKAIVQRPDTWYHIALRILLIRAIDFISKKRGME